jgi:copper homeostasis protein CutC
VRQIGPRHKQVARLEITDVVANECFTPSFQNKMKFVFLMGVPAAQIIRPTMF